MKGFLIDRLALSFAAVGIVLMLFTLLWRINPVEGSVVPRFLSDNPLGVSVFCVLFATCMPAYIGILMLGGAIEGAHLSLLLAWIPEWFPLFNLLALLLQGVVYFLLGKLVSVCLRKWARTSDQPKGHEAKRNRIL